MDLEEATETNSVDTRAAQSNFVITPNTIPDFVPRCKYRYKECINPCTFRKGTSEFHSLCEYHRTKQNESQKRSDARRKDQISARRKAKRRQARAARERSTSAPSCVAKHELNAFAAGSPCSAPESTYSPSEGFSSTPRGRVDRIFDILNPPDDTDQG